MNYNTHDFNLKLLNKTKPIMAYDGTKSFEEWQKEAESKLYELLGMGEFTLCEDKFEILNEYNYDTYKRIDFHFQSEEDSFVPASLLVPNNVKLPAPTMVCVQGHTTGMHVSLGETEFGNEKECTGDYKHVRSSDFGVRAVKEGFASLCIEQRYMGKRGRDPKEGTPDCLVNGYHTMLSLMLGRTPIGERVWDISRLIDVAEKHLSQYVDNKRLVCIGNSGGGTATFYASCLDKRIAVSVPSCAVCTYDDSILAMFHCNCNYVPGIRKYFNMGDLCGLILPRKLIIVSGKKDEIFPIDGAVKSYETAKEMYTNFASVNDCVHLIGDEGHRSYPDLWWPVIKEMI